MIPTLVTSNIHKAREFQAIFRREGLELSFKRMTTLELQSDSLEEIAVFSSIQAHNQLRRPVFVEDAGLYITSLNGFPGPYTSYVYRTLGVEGLVRLLPADNRKAMFKSAIAYYDSSSPPRIFRGCVKGTIADAPRGRRGFGFDPIFIPEGYDETFAELGPEVKMDISHRSRSAQRLIRWLREQG